MAHDSTSKKNSVRPATAVDLFCGAGGLTRGLLDAGVPVAAGYDIDEACKYPYEHNNKGVKFFRNNVTDLNGATVAEHYPEGHVRILVGCAPCQTFSSYTQGLDNEDDPKWTLLNDFSRLVRELKPDIVSMENVPSLQRYPVYQDFLNTLQTEGFNFTSDEAKRTIYCPDYGLAQQRRRLVIIASKFGPIELVKPTHTSDTYRKISDVIRNLPPLGDGEVCATDPLHRTSQLSPLNARRLAASIPGGTWRDWPTKLVTKCHREKKNSGYSSVYGRLDWQCLAPTMTTQFMRVGSGRFGHPEQLRALSLREGALLQSFPPDYEFVKPGEEYNMNAIGRMIGNAVPVRVGKIVGDTIREHLATSNG